MRVMKSTIEEIRRRNLELLIEEFGSQAAVAYTCKTSVSYISQIISRFSRKRDGKIAELGTKFARVLETGCNKPLGWMDVSHEVDSEEIELVQLYDKMNDEMREVLLNHARLMVKMKK